MDRKILTSVTYRGGPSLFAAIEWTLEEVETMREGLRLMRDTREHWRAGHRVSAAAKLAALSNEVTAHDAIPKLQRDRGDF